MMFIILFIRTFIVFTAICLFYLSLAKGPISLVVAVNGKEEINKQALFSKASAIILIVAGVILINQ